MLAFLLFGGDVGWVVDGCDVTMRGGRRQLHDDAV
ncbi:hypothetical protein JOC95_000273 [Bacillus tianshenii]|uniref:Uncharacterized protein n=1 Tax=Sutcliffiella tianshenii TaxID=1463404 RepID=A0ABS2NUU3_9BACI|nr:hypothetical protein [Bacillus tianshenii]